MSAGWADAWLKKVGLAALALWDGGVGMQLAQAGLVWCSSAARVRANGFRQCLVVKLRLGMAFPTGWTDHVAIRICTHNALSHDDVAQWLPFVFRPTVCV